MVAKIKTRDLCLWLGYAGTTNHIKICERLEPRSHFKSRLSLIIQVNVALNRTVVVDSD